jgi:hypothetical protein
MRGWIILDSLMVLGGFVSRILNASSRASLLLCMLGLTLLVLTLAARLVRGRV